MKSGQSSQYPSPFDSWALFTSGDISKILGISPRKVVLFVEQGVIQPSQPATGRGNARKFTFSDILQMDIALQLEALGLVPRFIKAIMETFKGIRLDDGTGKGEGFKPNVKLPEFIHVKSAEKEPRGTYLSTEIDFPDDQDEDWAKEMLRESRSCIIVNLRVSVDDLAKKVKAHFGA